VVFDTVSFLRHSSDRRTRPYYILSQDSLRMVQHSASLTFMMVSPI
jgi:hypothetical protein